ncbi:MAG: hypothetical protein AB7F89_27285, partial [Pirellulaceae bacterium]
MSSKLRWLLVLVISLAVSSGWIGAQERPGPKRGPGFGKGRGAGKGGGPGGDMRADQDVFHFLLEHHAEIRRSVERLPKGVSTRTESDNPQVAAKIQEHVAAMKRCVESGSGLRF